MSVTVAAAPAPILQFFNNAGALNAGGSVLTQVGGVNAATYQDAAGNTALPNPIPLNSRGEISNAAGQSCQLFLPIGVTYTFTLFDALGNQLNQPLAVSSSSAPLNGSVTDASVAAGAGIQGSKLADSSIPYAKLDSTVQAAIPLALLSAGNTAAQNKAILDAALASNSVVEMPAGTFDISALASVTSSRILFGQGRATVLRFNTTGVGITVDVSSSAQQSGSIYFHDFAIKHGASTPSAFIQNGATNAGSLNATFERLYFNSATTSGYCIDNFIGYGTKIRGCVFADVTGNAVRFQDSLNQASGYSFVASIDGSDFTRVSGNAILVNGAQVLGISNSIIEACGAGIVGKMVTNSAVAFNVRLDGVYFESNTGADIDFSDSNSTYWGLIQANSCFFNATPQIALGPRSEITLTRCTSTGTTTITGSSNAYANLIDCVGTFTKSGTFAWSKNNETFTYTAAITGIPVTSQDIRYVRNGNIVTVIGRIVFSGAATGDLLVDMPYPAVNNPNATLGNATGNDTGVRYYPGTPWLFSNTGGASGVAQIKFHNPNGAAEFGNAGGGSPFAWGATDALEFQATYFTNSP